MNILDEKKDQGHTAKLTLVLEAIRLIAELLRDVFIEDNETPYGPSGPVPSLMQCIALLRFNPIVSPH